MRLTARAREGTHAKYHYLICGVQGDFTRSLVNDPPTHLWTRQLKVRRSLVSMIAWNSLTLRAPHFQFAGVSNTSTLYKRGIRVCTGTGIGAALSTCIQVRCLTLGMSVCSHGACVHRVPTGECRIVPLLASVFASKLPWRIAPPAHLPSVSS